MVRDLEFDVCEMAPTTYLIARARGAPYIALPIFVMRRFHHAGFVVRPDSGITRPKDLEGKRVGVRAYSVTTGVWTRGIFVNEYGLDFVQGHLGGRRRGARRDAQASAQRHPCAGGKVARRHDGERRIARRLLGPRRHRPRRPADQRLGKERADAGPGLSELIPDAAKTEAEWFRRTGIYPIHGTIVVKTDVLAKHPQLGKSLFKAFAEAKKPYLARLARGEGHAPEDERYRALMPLLGDPLPYGTATKPREHRGADHLRVAAGADSAPAAARRGFLRPGGVTLRA